MMIPSMSRSWWTSVWAPNLSMHHFGSKHINYQSFFLVCALSCDHEFNLKCFLTNHISKLTHNPLVLMHGIVHPRFTNLLQCMILKSLHQLLVSSIWKCMKNCEKKTFKYWFRFFSRQVDSFLKSWQISWTLYKWSIY